MGYEDREAIATLLQEYLATNPGATDQECAKVIQEQIGYWPRMRVLEVVREIRG